MSLVSPPLLLLLLLLGAAPPTLSTQQLDSGVTDIHLMLDLLRHHMITAGTLLEDVKLITMSMEQMTQRMDTLEASMAAHIIDMANQTEKIEDSIAKEVRKLEDKIDNNVTRLLEPLVKGVKALRKKSLPRDCSDIASGENSGSGVYDIFHGLEAVHVYCDIDGSEGWTVLQRRVNGPQEFDKGWAEYKKGFGDLEGEHWVGNENMYILTAHKDYMIQFVLEGCERIGDVLVANYGVFRVGSETSGYRLTVDGFSGNATDGMNGCTSKKHNGMKFSTKDRDNDLSRKHFAQEYPGAWWFNDGYCSHLNRQGYSGGVVVWYNTGNDSEFIKCKKTKMRIKPLTS